MRVVFKGKAHLVVGEVNGLLLIEDLTTHVVTAVRTEKVTKAPFAG